MREKFPDRVPLIVERAPNARIGLIDKSKFLVPEDLSLMEVTYIIRKRLTLKPEETLNIFLETTFSASSRRVHVKPPATSSLASIYSGYKDQDGFLYLIYCEENTLGASE